MSRTIKHSEGRRSIFFLCASNAKTAPQVHSLSVFGSEREWLRRELSRNAGYVATIYVQQYIILITGRYMHIRCIYNITTMACSCSFAGQLREMSAYICYIISFRYTIIWLSLFIVHNNNNMIEAGRLMIAIRGGVHNNAHPSPPSEYPYI